MMSKQAVLTRKSMEVKISSYLEAFTLFAELNGYKRIGDCLVKNIPGTTTWKKVLSDNNNIPLGVDELVMKFEEHKFDTDRTFYNHYVDPDLRNEVIQILKNNDIGSFESLGYSRLAFEFKNGVYISKNIRSNNNKGRFIKRNTPEYGVIQPTLFTSSQSDAVFDSRQYDHWSDIKTPYLDMIIDNQGFSDDVKKWMYILLGRLLYPLRLLDTWEVVIFICGEPTSGKSTLLNILAHIIGTEHIFEISHHTNKGFILGKCKDARLIIADKICDAFPLDPPTLDLMMRGKSVNTILPYRSIEKIIWDVPMICSGKEKKAFERYNSVWERMITFDFVKPFAKKAVENVDIDVALENESAKILRKINEAYLEAISNYRDIGDIKSVLPRYFKQ